MQIKLNCLSIFGQDPPDHNRHISILIGLGNSSVSQPTFHLFSFSPFAQQGQGLTWLQQVRVKGIGSGYRYYSIFRRRGGWAMEFRWAKRNDWKYVSVADNRWHFIGFRCPNRYRECGQSLLVGLVLSEGCRIFEMWLGVSIQFHRRITFVGFFQEGNY